MTGWLRLALMGVVLGIGLVGIFSVFMGTERPLAFRAKPLAKNEEKEVKSPPPKPTGSGILKWQEVRAKIGENARATFAGDGRLVSIVSKPGTMLAAHDDFDPLVEDSVWFRAQSLLEELAPLAEIALPLDRREARLSKLSAQAFFKQTVEGAPVEPHGSVVIDLGSKGELVGFHSSVIPNMIPFESKPEARAGSQLVLWVPYAEGPADLAKWAYRTSEDGYETVRDAKSGKIIFRRDRKMKSPRNFSMLPAAL